MSRTREQWQELAASMNFDGRAVINGKRVKSLTGESIEATNPATGQAHSSVQLCGAVDVDVAVSAAREAFESGMWSRVGSEFRKTCLLRLADLIEERADEFALLDTLDMGKSIRESSSVDAPGAAALFRFYAEAIDKLQDAIPVTPPGSTALVTREPLGVVGIIVAWNYPLEIATWKLAPALAMGNTVVIKPPIEAPHSVLLLAEIAAEAGIPSGVINAVPGRGSVVGEAMGRHRDIDMIAFTGSTEVAKKLQQYAGESNLKRLALEAGGKSANIIFADCSDLRLAAEKAAFGSFYNQGEVCSANSRIFVERRIYDTFLAYFTEAAEEYTPGDPLDPEAGNGCLVSEEHATQVLSAIDAGRRDGRIITGGNDRSGAMGKVFVAPTIITDLPPTHDLHMEEIFGPVALVTPFDSEDEAIAHANSTEYGLAASVWTSDLSRAHRVSQQLVAGTVSVNTVDALGFTTPFGGFKQSGFGRDLSVYALHNYSALKTTWMQWG